MLYVAEVISNDLGFALGDASLATIPESETNGFEIDLNWRPNDNWMVQLGIANLDTEITKSPTIADLRGINPDASVNDDAFENGFGFVNALFSPIEVGTSLTQSPEWSYNGIVAYEFEVSSDYFLRVQTSYSRTDEQFALLSDPNALYDATSSLNALISIESLASNNYWKVTLWGRNITDNDSETYAFSGFAGRTVYRQQPATYGITFRYEY
jgi:iron complex outermembrane receptor protein